MHSYATVALLGAMLTVGAQATAPPVITAAPSPSQIAKAKRQASASPSPLTAYSFAYSDVPYQVNPYPVGRGPQSGFNQCNASTTGPNSQCQTAVMNNISDFCLWGSPTSGGTIGDVEAAVVAYCTTDKYGSRVIPAGAITGLQVLHTSEYIQWTGHIDMTALGLTASDTGGELDPHGADLLGNPLGGLVFSTSMPGGDNSTELQVQEWNNFVGSGVFCWKSCFNPSQGPGYCQNRFDLLGCSYNMPAAYEDNVFLECDADLQDIVGTYTGTDGKTTTWSQPESLPATSTLPWTPRVPSSSNCRTYTSSNLFPATLLGYQSSSAASATSGASGASSGASSAASTSGAKSGSHASSSGPSATNSAANASASHTSGGDSILAMSVSLSVLVGLVGGIFALA